MKNLTKLPHHLGAFVLDKPLWALSVGGLALALTVANSKGLDKSNSLEDTLNTTPIIQEFSQPIHSQSIHQEHKHINVEFVQQIPIRYSNLPESYSSTIQETFKDINSQFSHLQGYVPWRPEDEKFIEAIIEVETGSIPYAKEFDPMQVSNYTCHAVKGVRSASEGILRYATHLPETSGISHARRVKGKWNYSKTGINSDKSLEIGIWWLTRLRFAVINPRKGILSDRGFLESADRYRGKKLEPEYKLRVMSLYEN